MALISGVVRTTLEQFTNSIVDALPAVLSGALFLIFGYLLVRLVRGLLRGVLGRAYPADQGLVVDFFVLVVSVFLWFGIGLVFLQLVGMGDLAASLGTAAGFIGLGLAYALSEMIEDTVAGVYLLRDPDFNPGDTVTADGTTGVVTEISLRKSRLARDGDTVVIANRDVESKWTKESSGESER